jgi:SAM-dependent methyltransferase
MPFYDYYDDLPSTGIGRSWAVQQATNVLSHIQTAKPDACSLLEIGPGHGAFAHVCVRQGLRYLALDVNQRLLSAVHERGLDAIRALVPPLPLAAESVDIAFASHVIEHTPGYREAAAFLGQMRDVVAPGGLVVLVAPDYLGLREDFWNCDYSHSFVTTRRRMRQLMRDCGLVVVDDRSVWGPLQGPSGWIGGQVLGSRALGALGRAIPGRFGERVYKVRLTFARAVLMIGQVP